MRPSCMVADWEARMTESKKLNGEGAAQGLSMMVNDEVVDRSLKALGMPTDGTLQERCRILITASAVRSQGDYVALVINVTHGEGLPLSADDVTRALAMAFPNARIGDRHGPHYISLARTGKLKGLREDLAPIPHMRRPAAKEEDVEEVAEAAPPTVDEIKSAARERLMEIAEQLGVKASGKTEAIRQRCTAAIAA